MHRRTDYQYFWKDFKKQDKDNDGPNRRYKRQVVACAHLKEDAIKKIKSVSNDFNRATKCFPKGYEDESCEDDVRFLTWDECVYKHQFLYLVSVFPFLFQFFPLLRLHDYSPGKALR